MQIDLKLLAENLFAAESFSTPFPCDVPGYLIKNVYEPLKRDETVYFADLDFSAFTLEDINAFRDMLERKEHHFHAAGRIIRHFCDAPPVSMKTRAFC